MYKNFDIRVSGRSYLVEAWDDGSHDPWLPKLPLKVERVIDDEKAYVVDAEGAIWIFGRHRPESPSPVFFDTCTREGIMYIMINDPIVRNSKPSDVFLVLGIDDPRGPDYDELWQDWLALEVRQN